MSMSTVLSPRRLLASELYAIAHSHRCIGTFECHWCAGRCNYLWLHDDPPPVPFVRTVTTALRPANPYACAGCWLYRRRRVTVNYLGGGLKDGQTIADYSWWLTAAGVWAVAPSHNSKEDAERERIALYDNLLKPPLRFALSLLGEARVNYLQLAVANDLEVIEATTQLGFTVNNVPHVYTIYELEEALKRDSAAGCEPGVQVLFRLLGSRPDMRPAKKAASVGSYPGKEKQLRKVIAASGYSGTAA